MHRRLILFLLALPLLLVAAIWKADIKTDISAFFMVGDSPQASLIASNMQAGEISRRYLISIASPGNEGVPPDFVDQLREHLAAVEGVERVWGEGLSEEELEKLIRFYLPWSYALYSLHPQVSVPNLFSEQALNARAEALREGLLSPEGELVKRIVAEDPLLLVPERLRRLSNGAPQRNGYASLIVQTSVPGLDSVRQRPIRDSIEAAFASVNALRGNHYALAMTGVPVFAMAAQKQVSQDIKRVSTISMVLMLLFFLWMFRSLRALLIVMLTLVAAATVATLLTSLIFGQIHALTLALGTTLIGICVDYPIHTMVHAAGSGRRADVSARVIWPSLMLGALTTMIGYAALSFTAYPGMQQIALYAAAGILTSLLLARFVVPYAIMGREQTLQSQFSFAGWLRIATANRFRLLPWILAMALLLPGLLMMNWQDDLNRLSPSLESLKAKDQEIRSRMQSIEPGRFVLIQAKDMESALQASEQAARVLERLKAEGKLTAYHAIYPWLASAALQQRNIDAFAGQLNDASLDRWHRALEANGLSSDALPDPVLPKIGRLTLADVVASPAGRYIAGQYIERDHDAILTIWLGRHDEHALRKALAAVPHAIYVSQKAVMNEMNGIYRNKAIEALAYGSLIMLLLLAFRYRSPALALRALAPAMVSVAIVLGCWGISGQPLGMLHLVGMLLAVAICVDYGIFFIENRARDMRLTYRAIVASALTTVVAFSCLGLAENPALQILAWTVAPGVFLGFFLCPLLVRPAMALADTATQKGGSA